MRRCAQGWISALVWWAAAAQAEDGWIRAAAEARVGDGPAALASVGRLPARDGDHAAVARLIEARARLALGEPGLAAAALDFEPPEPLAEAHALLSLRAAVAGGAAPGIIEAAAARLASQPGLAPAAAAEAALRGAVAALDGVGPTLARARLEALTGAEAPPAVQVRALEALARAGGRGPWDRRLLLEFGHTPAGQRAAARLDPKTLPAADRAARAAALFAARDYAGQQAEDLRLATEPDRGLAQAAQRRLCQGRLRLFEDPAVALAHCEAAAAGPDPAVAAEGRYQQLIALGRLRRFGEAVRVAEAYLATGPSPARQVAAGYQLGRLWHEAGRWAQAAAALEAFVAGLRRDQDTWRWFIGWAWYRAGDCPRAAPVLAALSPDANLLVGPKALYWSARCAVAQGQPALARLALGELARRAPLSYYGALGEALARRLGEPPKLPRPPGAPFAPATEDALDALEPALLAAAPSAQHAALRADLRALRLRVRAGFPESAAGLADGLAAAAPDLQAALERLTERYGEAWARQPHRRLPWIEGLLDQPAEAARAAYPAAWLPLARAAGRAEGVSPWWLIAHMLQESRFKARARSHAGAMGPMQVLPRTGLRIAARLGFPAGDFFEDELYEPGVALRHAAWYLAALRREFKGRVTLAMAGYNAGPLRMAAHVADHLDLGFAEMVEEIGAHEARNYLRKVADHLIRYAALYADDGEYAALWAAVAEPGDVPVPLGELDF